MWFIVLFYLFCSIKGNNNFIQNANVPLCKNCIYFQMPKHSMTNLGRCTKFGTMDIVSGEIEYDFACHCRNDKNSCGFNGTYFEERKFPHITNNMFQTK